jgi:hypothetical protein
MSSEQVERAANAVRVIVGRFLFALPESGSIERSHECHYDLLASRTPAGVG